MNLFVKNVPFTNEVNSVKMNVRTIIMQMNNAANVFHVIQSVKDALDRGLITACSAETLEFILEIHLEIFLDHLIAPKLVQVITLITNIKMDLIVAQNQRFLDF